MTINIEQFKSLAQSAFQSGSTSASMNAEICGCEYVPVFVSLVACTEVEGTPKDSSTVLISTGIGPETTRLILEAALAQIKTVIEQRALAQPAANERPC